MVDGVWFRLNVLMNNKSRVRYGGCNRPRHTLGDGEALTKARGECLHIPVARGYRQYQIIRSFEGARGRTEDVACSSHKSSRTYEPWTCICSLLTCCLPRATSKCTHNYFQNVLYVCCTYQCTQNHCAQNHCVHSLDILDRLRSHTTAEI